MSKIIYLTEEGYNKLKHEVEHLQSVERPSISRQIAEARDKGDLSENAEYDAAKEAQGLLEMKIAKLQETLRNARIIDQSKLDSDKVQILSTVKIQNTKTKAIMDYTLVAETEANLKEKKISVSSPIGKGLMGKAKGDVVEIIVPNGVTEFKIIDITGFEG